MDFTSVFWISTNSYYSTSRNLWRHIIANMRLCAPVSSTPDSPIQQRPAEWFASACTSLPAAARTRHERPTVFHPVTAYPLRPARGARSCGDGSKLPLTAQDRARTVAVSPQDVYLVPWAQQMPVVAPSHNTKKGVAPSDQHWETAPRELGTEESRARRNGAHRWRAKGEAGSPVTTYKIPAAGPWPF